MKKLCIVLCVVFALCQLLIVPNALSREGVELGSEVYYYNYEEPGYMENTGVFFGVNGSYTQHFDGLNFFNAESGVEDSQKRTVLRLDGRFAYGQVDYSSKTTGELDNVDDFVLETRLTGGYDFNMSEKCFVTPYIGLGYRYLNDDSAGDLTTTGAAGYERESNYFYLPIGADFHGALNELWYVNLNIEFDVFLLGTQKSHLSDAVAGLGSVSNDQEEGYGVRGSVRLSRDNENTTLFIEPFVRYWHIGDSEISSVTYGGVLVGYGLEPKNKTLEAGLKVGMQF